MTVVTRKFNFIVQLAVIVGLSGIQCARAEAGGGIELNEAAFKFATDLIEQGHVIADSKGSWSEHHPSIVQGNEFIRVYGLPEYAKWYLGVDRRFSETSKRRYKFPYGDFKNVHRCGLLAAKARARQYGYTDIKEAATELVRSIKTKPKD
jgi:hypothetical protein